MVCCGVSSHFSRGLEDVLLLSRRDRQKQETIDLSVYLRDFVTEFCQTENMAHTMVEVDVASDLVIDFDPMHLHQILWNLMRNARRYCSRKPGSIILTAAATTDMVNVELYNDGPAIPEEVRQRLFEPFYSTDRTGTGLGLYISLELAEANGAQLRCSEQTQGARFRLSARLHR